MKKTILPFSCFFCYLFSMFFFSIAAFSQQNENNYKWGVGIQLNTLERQSPLEDKVTGDFSVYNLHSIYVSPSNGKVIEPPTLKDNSLALSIFMHYYLQNNIFMRAKVGIGKVNVHYSDAYFSPGGAPDTNVNIINKSWEKRSDYNVSIGFGKSLEINHLKFYGGFEIPYTYYGKKEFNFSNTGNYASNGAPDWTYNTSGKLFSSYSIGLGNFLGFTFIFKRFEIGGEISYAFLYNKESSVSTEHINNYVYIYPNNSPPIDLTDDYHLSNFDFSKVKPSIFIMYHF